MLEELDPGARVSARIECAIPRPTPDETVLARTLVTEFALGKPVTASAFAAARALVREPLFAWAYTELLHDETRHATFGARAASLGHPQLVDPAAPGAVDRVPDQRRARRVAPPARRRGGGARPAARRGRLHAPALDPPAPRPARHPPAPRQRAGAGSLTGARASCAPGAVRHRWRLIDGCSHDGALTDGGATRWKRHQGSIRVPSDCAATLSGLRARRARQDLAFLLAEPGKDSGSTGRRDLDGRSTSSKSRIGARLVRGLSTNSASSRRSCAPIRRAAPRSWSSAPRNRSQDLRVRLPRLPRAVRGEARGHEQLATAQTARGPRCRDEQLQRSMPVVREAARSASRPRATASATPCAWSASTTSGKTLRVQRADRSTRRPERFAPARSCEQPQRLGARGPLGLAVQELARQLRRGARERRRGAGPPRRRPSAGRDRRSSRRPPPRPRTRAARRRAVPAMHPSRSSGGSRASASATRSVRVVVLRSGEPSDVLQARSRARARRDRGRPCVRTLRRSPAPARTTTR